MLNAGNEEQCGLRRQFIRTDEAQLGQELKCGHQLGFQVGNKDPRAPGNGLADFGKGDFDGVEQKIEDWINVGVGVGSKELRIHVKDPADGGGIEAHGGEALSDGLESRERG